jgi:hypothetical protein
MITLKEAAGMAAGVSTLTSDGVAASVFFSLLLLQAKRINTELAKARNSNRSFVIGFGE